MQSLTKREIPEMSILYAFEIDVINDEILFKAF